MVYFDILVTIQRQFINVQYRDTSKVENMVRIGVSIQSKQLLHPYIFNATIQLRIQDILGVKKYGFAKMWGGGGARGSYLAHSLYSYPGNYRYMDISISTGAVLGYDGYMVYDNEMQEAT